MSMSIGSKSYAPSRQLFTAADRKPAADEEALPVKLWKARRPKKSRRLRLAGGESNVWTCVKCGAKVSINPIIWFICACAVFVIAVLGVFICPTEHVFSSSELASHSVTNDPNNAYVAIRVEVFDLTQLTVILAYAGTDQPSCSLCSALCNGVTGSVSPWVTLDSSNQTAIVDAKYHDFLAKGFHGYQPNETKNMAQNKRAVVIIDGMVYEMTSSTPGRRAPDGQQAPQGVDVNFMSQDIINMFSQYSGQNVSKLIGNIGYSNDMLARRRSCLRNLFLIGKVDHRNSPQYLFGSNILLAFSIVIVSIIGFRFIVVLLPGAARAPEDHDRFVICPLTCYTKGKKSPF
ncbi:cytochrome b5 [Ceratobasidium sp. AG-Ba]|nr:cytochrome b5 [Ceratobasidium sp. AG-Ba]